MLFSTWEHEHCPNGTSLRTPYRLSVFSQKVTTLIPYQNQRCWVERPAFFDTKLPLVALDKKVTENPHLTMSQGLALLRQMGYVIKDNDSPPVLT